MLIALTVPDFKASTVRESPALDTNIYPFGVIKQMFAVHPA